ncbi:MAG: hypothetical protein WJ306_13240 [Ferrovum myxofaciens]
MPKVLPVSPKAGIDYPRNYAEFLAWFHNDAACLDYLNWIRCRESSLPIVPRHQGLAYEGWAMVV